MTSSDAPGSAAAQEVPSNPTWTYPTRFCRICREDVPATVTLYPPGLPPSFQRPIIEYKNEDEYGRLIKPCHCRGGMRYIHELCLLRSRTENNRAGSMWKCHECGYKFNFQRLAVQRWLSSPYSSGVLTVMVMLSIMFVLGFVADPIINLYVDPYDTVMGRETMWNQVKVRAPASKEIPGWAQHFVKGLVSMGLVGFLKTLLLNPFQWWNIRSGGLMGSRTTTSTTGRDRAVNISWIAVVIGISSAFYFFYRWVQSIVQRSLQRIGNNIVDTSLPGDDDDLKPPPGWKADSGSTTTESHDGAPTTTSIDEQTCAASDGRTSDIDRGTDEDLVSERQEDSLATEQQQSQASNHRDPSAAPTMAGSWFVVNEAPDETTQTSSINNIHRQGWSFSNL